MNVPLARYSRDEIAVVNGGTGMWLSSLAPRVRDQPSGVVIAAGTPGGTCPFVAGGAFDATGSAPADGAMDVAVTRETTITAAWRSTTAAASQLTR